MSDLIPKLATDPMDQTEDIAAQTLEQALQQGPLRLRDALRVAYAIAIALQDMHARGLIHRNIKSKHILLGPRLDPITLQGFDLTKAQNADGAGSDTDSLLNNRLRPLGDLLYIAPEQTGRLHQPVDHRADLYALGIVLYEALTGKTPFVSDDPLALIHSHIAKDPVPPDEIAKGLPRAVSLLVLKLLSKSASDRYQTARGLAEDLARCIEELDTHGHIEDFPLASADQMGRFRIPSRLYGREEELAALLAAHAAAEQGKPELVLLAGTSGVGKSALASTIERPVLENGGYFGRGKFDPFERALPYSALLSAFDDVFRQILSEDNARVAGWREAILSTLGAKASVLSEVIPELGLLLGEQQAAEELGPNEAQNRLHLAFEELVGIFSAKERALCLFLDDLQWADAPSLRLIQTFMSSPDKNKLFIVGAYRQEELGENPELVKTIQAIEQAHACPIRTLCIKPLTQAVVTQLIADTLQCPLERAALLGELIEEKTGGNPFFITQILNTLHDDGFFHFDPEHQTWRWDLAQIRDANLQEDIVALLESRLAKLDPNTRRALGVAACIGTQIELDLFSDVSSTPIETLMGALQAAEEAGLLQTLPPTAERRSHDGTSKQHTYTFPHDRIRQAAHHIIAEEERPSVHLSIGLAMLKRALPHELEERLFDIVAHTNKAIPLLLSTQEKGLRERICALNLKAAQKARSVAAHDTALACLRSARALLANEAAGAPYELARDVQTSYAESLALLGQAEQARSAFEQILPTLKTVPEKGAFYLRQSEALQCAGKPAESYAHAAAGLGLFGVDMPSSAEQAQRETGEKIGALLRPETLVALQKKEAAPEEENLLSRLYERTIISSYFAAPANLGFAICKAVEHILERGIAAESSTIIAWFATLAGLVGQLHLSVDLAELSLTLCESSQKSYVRGKTETVAYAQCLCWKYPYERALAAVAETYERCHSVGDFQYASYMLITRYLIRHTRGNDCNDTLAQCRTWHDYCQKYAPLELGQAKIRIACLARVMDIQVEPIDPDAILDQYAREQNATDLCESLAEIAATHTLFGEHEEALQRAERAEPMLIAGAAGNLLIHLTFHEAKAHSTARMLSKTTAETTRQAQRASIQASLEKLAVWAALLPENFKAYHDIAKAELERAEGRLEEAATLYLRALTHARDHGQTMLHARAHEYLGELYQAQGHRFASAFFDEACALYETAGAKGKAKALEAAQTRTPQRLAAPPMPTATALGLESVDMMDALTMFKALQTMSGELDLPKLLKQLLHLVIENAGARRAVLLLDRDSHLHAEAAMTVSPDKLELGLSTPLEAYADLPHPIINYVARSKEPFVLGDATKEHRFGSDPYLAKRSPRSILCLPITHEKRTTGILYLEHDSSADVFNKHRVDVCRSLASQAAIALDNALLYARVQAMSDAQKRANDDLEREIERRTEELYAANERLQRELKEREEHEKEHADLKERIIEVQRQRLAELSTPVIPITDKILVMPLIGSMDDSRAQSVLDAALGSVAKQGAEVVIIDITGMTTVDTSVAATLLRTASALALLGARAVITGMSPHVAHTLVSLGVDFGSIVTRGTLQSGIAFAFEGTHTFGRRKR